MRVHLSEWLGLAAADAYGPASMEAFASTEVLAEARQVWVVATVIVRGQAQCQGRIALPKRAEATGGTVASLGLRALAADPASAEGHERSLTRRTFAGFSRAHQLLPAFSRH